MTKEGRHFIEFERLRIATFYDLRFIFFAVNNITACPHKFSAWITNLILFEFIFQLCRDAVRT